MRMRRLAAGIAACCPWPAVAFAQEAQADVTNSGDTGWLLAATLLTLIAAVPGMALFHAGRTRGNNAFSVLIQCAAIAAGVSLAWIIVGYTLAFGPVTNGWLGGGDAWMLISLGNAWADADVPESAFVLFQLAAVIVAAVSMTGAWAGRARFGWVVAFCSLWCAIVYAPVAHWLWGGGWLASGLDAADWGGGAVVFMTAGVSALVMAIMLGTRRGFQRIPEKPQNTSVTLIGAVLFWFGWLAFIGGSALAANDDAAAAIIAAHAAAAAGALTWSLFEHVSRRAVTGIGFASGALAGLATVSASAGFVSPGGAIVIGVIGAMACRAASGLVRSVLGIDDTLDVFAIQGVGGMVGMVLLAPFMMTQLGGVGYDEMSNPMAQLAAQLVAIGVTILWSIIATVIVALMASIVFPMRVSEEAETRGLDLASHTERD